MSIVSSKIVSLITTVETIALGPGNEPKVTLNGMDTTSRYTPSSTPAAVASSYFAVALVAGAATVDLTALPGPVDAATCGPAGAATAVQAIKIAAPTTNLHSIAVTPSTINGYAASGKGFIFASGQSVELAPGDEILWKGTAPTVGSACRDLTLTGSGTDVLNFAIILG